MTVYFMQTDLNKTFLFYFSIRDLIKQEGDGTPSGRQQHLMVSQRARFFLLKTRLQDHSCSPLLSLGIKDAEPGSQQ